MPKVDVHGASGIKYQFSVNPLNAKFEALGAVYIVTKRTKKPEAAATHKFLYVGETDDLSTRFDGHHKQACFDQEGANCIGIHLDGSEESRKTKEADLYRSRRWPCND